ncbi:MAG: putative fluoride ion transporter CrcB [Melioribacteraceae bacterium]|nr:MAG: putative fluoride ion transporter CrcB [Melioribacteraceae bacterium]
MLNFIWVFIGAGFGGGARWWISTEISKHLPAYFPFGTLAVNILGSFILGMLFFTYEDKAGLSQNTKLLIGTGFCGGFTTFSTFSLETVNLFRSGEMLLGSGNIIFNILFTIAGVYIAYLLTR